MTTEQFWAVLTAAGLFLLTSVGATLLTVGLMEMWRVL